VEDERYGGHEGLAVADAAASNKSAFFRVIFSSAVMLDFRRYFFVRRQCLEVGFPCYPITAEKRAGIARK
jgi:hypothetical protein